MREIVIHGNAVGFTAQLQTATGVDKRAQRIGGIRRQYAHVTRRGDRHQAVVHVVLAHQAPLHLAHFLTVEQHFPFGGIRVELFRLPVPLLANQLLLAPAPHRHSLLQVDVVLRQDNAALTRNNAHQMVELFLNRFQVVKDIRVIELKVVEDQRAWAVMHELGALVEERAVVFIRFNHKERAVAQTRGDVEIPRYAADHEARLVAAGFEDPGRHTGGGGFAVRPGNGDNPAVAQDKIMQPLRARHVRDIAFQHRFNAWIPTGHGVTHDHQIRLRLQLAGVISLNQRNSLLLEQRAHRRIHIGVRTCHFMAQRARQHCQSAHESATNPQYMNAHTSLSFFNVAHILLTCQRL